MHGPQKLIGVKVEFKLPQKGDYTDFRFTDVEDKTFGDIIFKKAMIVCDDHIIQEIGNIHYGISYPICKNSGEMYLRAETLAIVNSMDVLK
jgi:hypothetical protein